MFPIHTFSGSPYTIGYQHGVELTDSIHALWKLYHPLFGDETRALWERVAQYSTYIQQHVPALYREMEGIAAGSGLPLPYIIALNARSELIQSDIVNKDEKMNECTTIYAAQTHTLAQTWDFQNTIGDHVFIGIMHQDNGLTITQLMEPGIVGKIGCNSVGFAVSLNFLEGEKKSIGLPIHVFNRAILSCKHDSEITHCIQAYATGKTGAVCITTPDRIIPLEFNDNTAYSLIPSNNFARTNHYLHPEILAHHPAYRERYASTSYASSCMRYETATKILDGGKGDISAIKTLLADTSCGTLSISRTTPNHAGTITIANIIMQPVQNLFMIADMRTGIIDTYQSFSTQKHIST